MRYQAISIVAFTVLLGLSGIAWASVHTVGSGVSNGTAGKPSVSNGNNRPPGTGIGKPRTSPTIIVINHGHPKGGK